MQTVQASIIRGDLEALEVLRSAQPGFDVGAHLDNNEKNDTLLSLACRHNQTAVVEWLLERGADVDGMTCRTDGGGGTTAVYISCQFSHANCLRLLLNAGADANRLSGKNNVTPLIRACMHEGPSRCVQRRAGLRP